MARPQGPLTGMTRKCEHSLVAGLSSTVNEERLHAIRSIKNSVIGNKRQKTNFIKLGAVQLLVDVLKNETDPNLMVQAAATLGSLATAPDGLGAIIEQGAVPQLLKALHSSNSQVVEAAVRSLKMIYKAPSPAPTALLFESDVLPILVSLLAAPQGNLAESAAAVLTHCSHQHHHQDAVAAAGAVPALTNLLDMPQRSRQDIALEALAALTAGNRKVSGDLLRNQGVVDRLVDAVKHSPAPRTQFAACVCLANICQQIPSEEEKRQLLEHSILPALVQLLADEGIGNQVAPVLCLLVCDNLELQRAAADAEAIPRLAQYIKMPSCNSECKEGVLRALSLLCSSQEKHRRDLIQANALPAITQALADESHAVRAAAVSCMQSLSRSSRLLRGNLAGIDLAGPLLDLSIDDDISVATQAAAALSNMAVEYSGIKDQLLRKDGVGRFAGLVASMHQPLRLHGIWGLSSIAYMSTPAVKQSIIDNLPWSVACALLRDPEEAVREKTMLLLRNLVYGGSPDVFSIMTWSSNSLLTEVKSVLEREEPTHTSIKLHALYTIVNLSSGGADQKGAVMEAGWPSVLATSLDDEHFEIREAAVWAIINLTWRRDDAGAADRCSTLRAVGLIHGLHRVTHDPSLQVRERASTALEQLEGGDLHSGDELFPDLDDDGADDDDDDDDDGARDILGQDPEDIDEDEDEDLGFEDDPLGGAEGGGGGVGGRMVHRYFFVSRGTAAEGAVDDDEEPAAADSPPHLRNPFRGFE